jgi:hypothetical protein
MPNHNKDILFTFALMMLSIAVLQPSFTSFASDMEKIDCNTTTYSSDWNLSYLRNVTRFCSNGGE